MTSAVVDADVRRPVTVVVLDGHVLATMDEPSFVKALSRGEIARTGTPLVYRLVHAAPMRPLTPEERRRRFVNRRGRR